MQRKLSDHRETIIFPKLSLNLLIFPSNLPLLFFAKINKLANPHCSACYAIVISRLAHGFFHRISSLSPSTLQPDPYMSPNKGVHNARLDLRPLWVFRLTSPHATLGLYEYKSCPHVALTLPCIDDRKSPAKNFLSLWTCFLNHFVLLFHPRLYTIIV